MSRQGLYLALEGIDGAGKSTLARSLATRCRSQGWTVTLLREPANARLGRWAQERGAKDPVAGALLFTLDRLLARRKLTEALHRHDLVLTDRSFFSTLAYQGAGMGRTRRAELAALQRSVTLVPDLVVLLDLPAETAVLRVRGRGRARAPLERLSNLRRVRQEYRRLARQRGWVILDARASPRALLEAVLPRLRPRRAAGRAARRRRA